MGFLFRKGKVREKEKAGFYVFGALEFENLREWEYTCTAGIYFMGISRARRFDILIWFDWLGLGGFFYFLKCARFFMCFCLFLGFFIFRKSRRACFAVNVDLSFHGTHLSVWAKRGEATILVTIYSRKKLKRWSKNGKL